MDQRPICQQSSGEWRKDENKLLVGISALYPFSTLTLLVW